MSLLPALAKQRVQANAMLFPNVIHLHFLLSKILLMKICEKEMQLDI